MGIFCIAVFLLFCHFAVGKYNSYRPLIEKATVIDKKVEIDQKLPLLNSYYSRGDAGKKKSGTFVFKTGDKIRLRYRTSNYMLPHKTNSRVSYLPEFASDPLRETYYYGYLVQPEGGTVGITYFGATTDSIIRESDLVEAEGVIVSVYADKTLNIRFWVRAEKIRRIQ